MADVTLLPFPFCMYAEDLLCRSAAANASAGCVLCVSATCISSCSTDQVSHVHEIDATKSYGARWSQRPLLRAYKSLSVTYFAQHVSQLHTHAT